MVKDKIDIIVGIDPGNTKGYAILDFEGNLIKLDSSKQFSVDKFIDEIILFGKPIIISTDVFPTPKFVKKIARATNARIISPKKPLDLKKKRNLTSYYSRELVKENLDKHKLDALAAAFYAFKKIRRTLNRIRVVLDKKGKSELENSIRRNVLRKNMSIKRAIEGI